MDIYGNPDEMGEYSDFLQMLWEHGIQIEREIVDKIRRECPLIEIKGYSGPETFAETLRYMQAGEPLIYQGVLIHGDKVGRPDLLEKTAGRSKFGDFYYIPCDIKSGRATKAEEGDEIKDHYAAQLLFYCGLLEIIQGIRPKTAKIIDINGEVTEFSIVDYEDHYLEEKKSMDAIVYHGKEPEPVICAVCKECVWKDSCLRWATERQDPTLLFKLGKQKYELKKRGITNIEDVKRMDIVQFTTPEGKIKRVGEKTLEAWKRRAGVWLSGKPLIRSKPEFKNASKEIYYDIEDDPSLDHVYLHGMVEVEDGRPLDYRYFLAAGREEEEKAARAMWAYIESLSGTDVIYHYGSYEKTKLKRLWEKYGLSDEVLEKFDLLRVDLYRFVEQCSDWPVSSYGIKSIARFLGFDWSAEDAGGANSIAWFNEYRKNPAGRQDLLEKILTYNREDCEAMIRVKEFLAGGGA